MGSMLVAFLTSGTFRRLLVTLVGMGVAALNKKFGLELDAGELGVLVTMVVAYIAQSASKETLVKRAVAAIPDGDREAAIAHLKTVR